MTGRDAEAPWAVTFYLVRHGVAEGLDGRCGQRDVALAADVAEVVARAGAWLGDAVAGAEVLFLNAGGEWLR